MIVLLLDAVFPGVSGIQFPVENTTFRLQVQLNFQVDTFEPFCLLLLALKHIFAKLADNLHVLLHSSIQQSFRQLCSVNFASCQKTDAGECNIKQSPFVAGLKTSACTSPRLAHTHTSFIDFQ